MKRRGLSLLLVMCIILSTFMALPITASAAESGKCGDNVYWTLDDNGTLTISGEGDMSVSSSSTVPWKDWRDKIKKVIVETELQESKNLKIAQI